MTTEEPPWDDTGNPFTVTLKGGKGYEEPWFVVKAGSAATLRSRLIESLGIEGDDLTLVEVIHQANVTFHAMSTLESRLGATIISQHATGDDPWTQAQSRSATPEPATPADPQQLLLDEIEAAETVDQLKRIWVANNPLNDVVKAAWSAKGKSLQEGGK